MLAVTDLEKKQGFVHFSLYKATSFIQEPIFEGFCRQYKRLDSKQWRRG